MRPEGSLIENLPEGSVGEVVSRVPNTLPHLPPGSLVLTFETKDGKPAVRYALRPGALHAADAPPRSCCGFQVIAAGLTSGDLQTVLRQPADTNARAAVARLLGQFRHAQRELADRGITPA